MVVVVLHRGGESVWAVMHISERRERERDPVLKLPPDTRTLLAEAIIHAFTISIEKAPVEAFLTRRSLW